MADLVNAGDKTEVVDIQVQVEIDASMFDSRRIAIEDTARHYNDHEMPRLFGSFFGDLWLRVTYVALIRRRRFPLVLCFVLLVVNVILSSQVLFCRVLECGCVVLFPRRGIRSRLR